MERTDIKIAVRGPRASELLRDTSIQKLPSAPTSIPDHPDADENASGRRSDAAALHMDPRLYRAAGHCDVDAFVKVLDKVSTEKQLSVAEIIRSTTPGKNTLAHLAALYWNSDLLDFMCQLFPPIVSARNLKGDTVLHVAARSGFENGVEYLLNLDRSPSFFQEVSLVAVLLDVRNEQGNTALHEAFLSMSYRISCMLVLAGPQLPLCLNRERASPFYLAVQAGDLACVKVALQHTGDAEPRDMLKGKSPLLASAMNAATTRNIEILQLMLEGEPRFVDSRDEEGRNMLHCAAYAGYPESVRFLVGKHAESAYEKDNYGLFPVHLAAMKGHLDVIKEIFQDCPYLGEMLSAEGMNILHIACLIGRNNIVKFVLQTCELEELINQRDENGNTPLHLATMKWHPRIVSLLTRDDRVNLGLVNNAGLAALNYADSVIKAKHSPPFREWLTWDALTSARAPKTSPDIIPIITNPQINQEKPLQVEVYKERVNTLLLVSTLIATVTFAAGFTAPGGYNNSNPDLGMATLLGHNMFHLFIFCDTIAMYSSIAVAVTLIWAQLGDFHLINNALRLALPLLGLALLMMSLAFMAATYLVVSALNWLSWCVLITSSVFAAINSLLFYLLFVLTFSVRRKWLSWRCFRFVNYIAFRLTMLVTGNNTTSFEQD